MKWYIEEETKELRETVEKEILKWKNVAKKKMFGCPCYMVNGKMFAGMVTKGIVITKLTSSERRELEKIWKIKPFMVGDRIIKKWIQINLSSEKVNEIIPFVKKSYENTIKNLK